MFRILFQVKKYFFLMACFYNNSINTLNKLYNNYKNFFFFVQQKIFNSGIENR